MSHLVSSAVDRFPQDHDSRGLGWSPGCSFEMQISQRKDNSLSFCFIHLICLDLAAFREDAGVPSHQVTQRLHGFSMELCVTASLGNPSLPCTSVLNRSASAGRALSWEGIPCSALRPQLHELCNLFKTVLTHFFNYKNYKVLNVMVLKHSSLSYI